MTDLDERSGSHPLPASPGPAGASGFGALDWRVVGLVALLAGGGGGTWATSMFSGAPRAELEKLTEAIEAVRTEQAAQSRTLVEIKAASSAVDAEHARYRHDIADHEERLRALERKGR